MSSGAAPAIPSLRQRLSRFVLLLALIWVLVSTVVLAGWLRHEVNELLDDGLIATSEALALVLQSERASPPRAAPRAEVAPSAPDAAGGGEDVPFAWQLLDAKGTLLMRSVNAPERRLAARLALDEGAGPGAGAGRAAMLIDGVEGWRVRIRPLADGRWLLVGQPGGERLEAALEVAGGTIAAALGVGLVGLAWLRRRLARETQPLDNLREVLARYDPVHATAPLPPAALQELIPVHEAVQQMGERLAANAAAERAFSAHAAHALRTPLAGLDAQLAVAQREAPPELQARLARMRAATGRLSHVVVALLALFRSGGELKRAPVDVQALLARVPLEGLAIEFEGSPAHPVADSDLLAAALINLLDNAVRHGALRVRIRVDDSSITLADDGPGVSADRLAHLRRALAREEAGLAAADHSPAAHDQALSGLGLALADRVARVHGGRLELLAPEAGFAVRLWLDRPTPPGAG